MGRGAQTEERVRFVYGFMRRSKSSTGMRRAHLFSGASGGRRSASAAVDGATAIPHLNEDTRERHFLPLSYSLLQEFLGKIIEISSPK